MRELLLALGGLLLVAGMAGCIGSDEAAPANVDPAEVSQNASSDFEDPIPAIEECTFHCKEPTVAVDEEGRVFVAEHLAQNDSGSAPGSWDGTGLVRSTDGGATFQTLGAPAIPQAAPPGSFQGDSLVQIGPDGSLYFSALVVDRYNPLGMVYGIQVARSDDGGETWATNELVSLAEDAHEATIDGDRQWLGFGPEGTVYISYAHLRPIGVFIHHSDDRGETWSKPFVVATTAERSLLTGIRWGQAGPPVVDNDGAVYVPMSWSTDDANNPSSVRVAVSTDQGRSWQTHEAFRSPSAGNWFPMLTVDEDDRLHLAALSGEGLRVTTSTDGAESWSDPATWTEEDPAVAPWIEATDGNLTVAYHQDEGEGVSLHVASRPLDAEPGTGPTERVQVADGLPSAHTDFTHLTTGPEGPWITWGEEDAGEIRLAGPASGE